MPETKLPFCQRPEFNVWLVTNFFLIFSVVLFAFLPVMGAHRLGVAVGDELSRYDVPAKPAKAAPKAEPIREPMEGIPVAYQSERGR